MNNLNKGILVAAILFIIFILGSCASAHNYVRQGAKKYNEKDYSGAIEDFNKEIENNSSSDSAYLMKGKAENLLGKFREAVDDFSKSIEMKNTFDAHFNRGIAYLSLNENENAEADFSSAIQLKPTSDTAYYCRGYVLNLLN